MFKHILLPTDGSDLSQKAVVQGVALAKSLGANVMALFVAPPPTPIIYRLNIPVGYAQPEDHQKLIDEATAKALGFVEKACMDAAVAYAGFHATSDFAEDEILKAVDRHGCDLIVIGTRGHSGLRGALIGSVTQKVLHNAAVPVMVVR
jgi:nucleotide-binding universal stress UspA family protein